MKKPADKKRIEVKGQRQSVILSANLKEQQQLENHVEGVNVKTFFGGGNSSMTLLFYYLAPLQNDTDVMS